MNRYLIFGLSAIFVLAGCAATTTTGTAPQAGSTQAGMTGAPPQKPQGPVIEKAYAAGAIYPGDTWKIYLKAGDPNSDMSYIVAEVFQPGYGEYPVSYTRVKAPDRKDLNGFVYLNTMVPGGYSFLNFSSVEVSLSVKDKAGNFSPPVRMAMVFEPRAPRPQEAPPEGVFNENELGPILVTLRPRDTGSGNGGGFK
ncbi:MAG TPA: hypothetical protein VLS90_10375 [Thermodesulfobacteriota bacterium]|nr:hypothetical protein [Thermodesulfobacteriota bacterium]